MTETSIEWADAVWNPSVGCTRVSEGCRACYAFALHDMRHAAHKAGKKLPAQYAKPFKEVQLMPDRLAQPLHWKKPRMVFVNSMSDLFHEAVPVDYIAQVFAVMRLASWHTFQVLTKRAERLAETLTDEFFPQRVHEAIKRLMGYDNPKRPAINRSDLPLPNVWLGVSVENRLAIPRIDVLRRVPAAVRFLSVEPLLEDLSVIGLDGIHWVIVGGESGPGSRPMHPDWARSIRDQCQAAGVPFFFKQWGEWFPSEMYDFDARLPALGGRTEIYVGLAGQVVRTSSPFEHGCPCCVPHGYASMVRVGKKAAGRLLDGREWNELPHH